MRAASARVVGYHRHMSDELSPVTEATRPLSERERAWLVQSEAVWREAHAIAAVNPGVDPGDIYHALRCLEVPPAERLRRGLTRVRHRPHSG